MKALITLIFAILFTLPAFCAKQFSYFRVGNPNDITSATAGVGVLPKPMATSTWVYLQNEPANLGVSMTVR